MLLQSLVSLRHFPHTQSLDPEDIFGDSLGSIFTDDLQNSHGIDPDTTIVYRPSNASYPDLEFRTADVKGKEERRKFAQYLWNAGVLMGECLGGRMRNDEGGGKEIYIGDNRRWIEGEWWLSEEEEAAWSVKGEKVLELGAGGWSNLERRTCTLDTRVS
jgi:hypothetical protein